MTMSETPAVELPDGVYWVDQCYEMAERHHHISPYLVDAPEGYVLVDTGAIEHQDVLRERIGEVVGEAGVAAAVFSHYDLPHVANARAFREVWDFDLYTSFSGTSASPEALGMGPSTGVMHDETREVCGRTLSFPWPPLVDAAHSMWVYDHGSKTMFVADMGHYHWPGDCRAVCRSVEDLPSVEDIRAYNEDALPFVKYLDAEKMRGAFEELVEAYDVEVWAPVHGNPIVGASTIDAYLDRAVEAIAETAAASAP